MAEEGKICCPAREFNETDRNLILKAELIDGVLIITMPKENITSIAIT